MKKILAIDGGGIRGIIPAMLLSEIERQTGKKIYELFDLIAGTSTGGVLACLLSIGKSSGEMVKFYEESGEFIFKSSIVNKFVNGFGLLGAKYNSDNLAEVLEKYLGDKTLLDCLTEIMVVSYDTKNRLPVFFKSSKVKGSKRDDVDTYLRHVAQATSSAPTFFKPFDFRGMSLIDGGVCANNPTMCAIVEAKKMWPDEELMIVSALGTGQLTRPYTYSQTKSWGLAGWAVPILNIVFDGMSDVTDYQCKKLCGTNYHRFQCELDRASDDMDNASVENLKLLKEQAKDLILKDLVAINTLCTKLL